MSTYSDHEQRLLDQQSGAELDRLAERKASEHVECDHEWEYEGADPSVGIMSGGKTCVKCGEEGPDDREDDFDDNYF